MPKIQTTNIYAKIQRAIDRGYTTVSLQGSSRSSKTYNTLIWLIMYCLYKPNTRLSIVRATLPAIKGSVFVDFKEILMKMEIYNEKKLNKSDMTYEFANGSWVEFFSTDSEQKLRGRKRDILFVNEANELSFLEWQQLKMRTTRFAIIDYNPSFSDEHWICGVNQDPRTHHFISTYKDNPFLEQAIVDEIGSLKTKNPTLWQVYGLGLQAIVEGVIFKEIFEVEAIPAHIRRRWRGLDFGYTNDPTTIVEVAIDGNNLYIDEQCYRTHMSSGDIIREFKELTRLKVIADSAEPREIAAIHRAGINIHAVKKYSGSVRSGINRMLEFNIHVTKRSTNIRKEFKNYTYMQDKDGKWLNEPIDCYNHAIDATRYVIMSEVLGGERKPIDKKRIAKAVH